MEFPKELFEGLGRIFGEEFHKMYERRNDPAFKGVRVNTLKCDGEKLSKFIDVGKPTPFCREGFYIDSDAKLGNTPLHHAGAFYVQEPSATSAVEILEPKPGDFVLDLCAAPGGKSTQIAAKLDGEGLLWSNEIVRSRANILLSNIERMGVSNAVVSSCDPKMLCGELVEAFDKVLVDAPCSGEGMMRHDESISREWTQENVEACGVRQLKILQSAAECLRPGGILVYSTCTFSKEENEDVAEKFLDLNPEFEPIDIEVDFGREGFGGGHTRRILWLDGGEGHFVAKFRKRGDESRQELPQAKPENHPLLDKFLTENGITLPEGTVTKIGDKFYLSQGLKFSNRCGILRAGLLIGSEVKGRIVPEHALFACSKVKVKNEINLENDDPRLAKFLHGEEIEIDPSLRGFCRISVENIPLSFGKAVGGRLKNHYPKGLRRLK